MTTYVDTCVLIDVLDAGAQFHNWSVEKLVEAKAKGPVFVSDAVFSELSVGLDTLEQAIEVINSLDLIRCGYSDLDLFDAGKAYYKYRKNNGGKSNVLPDFYIGALANSKGAPLITRDTKKIPTYFPNVDLITPE